MNTNLTSDFRYQKRFFLIITKKTTMTKKVVKKPVAEKVKVVKKVAKKLNEVGSKRVTKKASGRNVKKVAKSTKLMIPKSQMKRLVNIAGFPSISSKALVDVYEYTCVRMDELVKNTVTYCEHARRKTLSSSDVIMAAGMTNLIKMKIYGTFTEKIKTCVPYESQKKKRVAGNDDADVVKRRMKNKTIGLRKIRYYQKNSDKHILNKSCVSRIVRGFAQNYRTDMNFSTASLEAFRTIFEELFLRYFSRCIICSINNNRVTITLKDWTVVRELDQSV